MNPKQRAAQAALKYVASGMIVGLGTGSTADQFLVALGAAIREGTLKDIRGIPTSVRSDHRAQELGIPLVSLADGVRPDVTVDGADEVDPNLDLIKGLGGALLREKIVAQNSAKLVIIADASKVVERLGTKAMLPVEVVPFAHETQAGFLRDLGGVATLRAGADGKPFVTDNANYIYDVRFANGIADPSALEAALKKRAGVVETGLFLKITTVAFVADDEHAEECKREG